MPTSIFDRIINWPYHPHLIMTLSFVGFFIAAMQEQTPAWAALIAAAIAMPFIALVAFVPYVVIVALLSVLLSLPQAMRSARRH